MNHLVIVESPSKVKTIQKFLGKDYLVLASFGHISKLAKRGHEQLGIDIENWIPDIELDDTKLQYFKKIKTAAKKADKIWIATDADREGEAIGADIIHFLNANNRYARVKYKEITKSAVVYAFKHATTLNNDLVDAQKARRMLDRILGFLLSKLMRDKVKNVSAWNLSAGRVQSVALKLVIEREKARMAFVPVKYSRIYCNFGDNQKAVYFNPDSKFSNKEHEDSKVATKIVESINSEKMMKVTAVSEQHVIRQRSVPFKQSSIFRVSGYSATVTSAALQKLYEGYGEGGIITYPRTDATWLSKSFVKTAQNYIKKHAGAEYISEDIVGFDGDQDAHEAIRPTNISLTPAKAKATFPLSQVELNIYTQIWEQTIKAIAKSPIFLQIRYDFVAKTHKFYSSTNSLVFPGYYQLIGVPHTSSSKLNLKVNDLIKVKSFIKEDKETKPPTRYSEGTLIAKLDDIKVGRPSTFAHTVNRLKNRHYVEVKDGYLIPTPIGFVVSEKLQQGFSEETSENYTAKVEGQLDAIAEGKCELQDVLKPFWLKFSKAISLAEQKMTISSVVYEEVGKPCPQDQGTLIYKYQKNFDRKFIACSNFPKCRFTASKIEDLTETTKPKQKPSNLSCPLCSSNLLWRQSSRGEFLGCSKYPSCRFTASSEQDYEKFKNNQTTSDSKTFSKTKTTVKKT